MFTFTSLQPVEIVFPLPLVLRLNITEFEIKRDEPTDIPTVRQQTAIIILCVNVRSLLPTGETRTDARFKDE